MRAEDDWRSATLANLWSLSNGGGGPPGSTTFSANPQLQLRVSGAAGRFFLFVESTGVTDDGRLEAGMQSGSAYPPVGLALHRADPPLMQSVPPAPRDGVVLQCRLEPSDTPYVLSPFLQNPAAAVAAHPALGFRVTVYSDVDFTLGNDDPKCGGPKCDYNCKNCPMFEVYERLLRIEQGVDKHLSFLSQF